MKVVRNEDLTLPVIEQMTDTERLFVYNALDCCVTYEVKDAFIPSLDNITRNVYEFEKELMGPVLDMDLTGVRVDMFERGRIIKDFQAKLDVLDASLNEIITEGIGIQPINWRSPDQLKWLFYEVMRIPPVKQKGKITVNRDALEKLTQYFYAQPIVSHLLAMRDIGKKISTLKTEVDSDERMRTSYNIAGTDTGRFSSSLSAFGTGGNLQNITDELRNIFIADEGQKLAYIDLEQAESRVVGAIIWNLFGDSTYLDACESGDLHTSVCKMTWPNLGWTGDPRVDKDIAEQKFYRQLSYRDTAKRLGHGSNYDGKPPNMAKVTKVPQNIVAMFQNNYFSGFPGIPRWHQRVRDTLRTDGVMVSLTGRKRYFFGRRDEAATQRAAIANDPQGSVGDILNTGMLRVWKLGVCQLLMQIHDAIVVQYPEEKEQEILPQVINAIRVPIELNGGRQLIIPSEAKTGWNWSKYCCGQRKPECGKCDLPSNPNGLKKFKEGKEDERRRIVRVDLLDRPLS